MRVVHLCRVAAPSIGGMEAMVDGLSSAQRAAGRDVRIVTTMAGPAPAWTTSSGVPVTALRRIGPRRWPLAAGLREALRGADVVHVHGIDGLADQALTLRPAGAAVGVSTHGGYLHTTRQAALKQVWLRTGTAWSLRRADAIWFTSASDRVALAPARLRGEVVPDGVDLRRGRAIRSRRAPEPGRFVVLGRVDVHKGHDRLLRALGRLRALDPRPFTLDVIGPAPTSLRGALAELADGVGIADRVQFLGALDAADVDDRLATADLALFPSRREGFGLALVEALAAGVPCVVQPLPPFVEKVTDHDTGFVVDFEDAAAAARALAAVRDTDRRALTVHAIEAAEAWSWERVLPAWDAAYAAIGAVR